MWRATRIDHEFAALLVARACAIDSANIAALQCLALMPLCGDAVRALATRWLDAASSRCVVTSERKQYKMLSSKLLFTEKKIVVEFHSTTTTIGAIGVLRSWLRAPSSSSSSSSSSVRSSDVGDALRVARRSLVRMMH